jgi:hypothetical protein
VSNKQLFDAGADLGRAHILAMLDTGTAPSHLRRAALYLRQAGREPSAVRADQAAGNPTVAVVQATVTAIQGDIPYPDQHPLNAGINLGWAIETCIGTQREDVEHVIKNLQDCAAHLKAMKLNARQVDHLINPALDPIKNLYNALFPKPQELPQYKPSVEKLLTGIKGLMK